MTDNQLAKVVAARLKAAEDFDLIRSEALQISYERARVAYIETILSSTRAMLPQQNPVAAAPVSQISDRTRPQASDVEAALEIVTEILDTVEDLPSAAQEFGESVLETTTGIAATIESSGAVTEAQFVALNNMLAGVKRWIR